MRQITTTVYQFDELNEEAQEKARKWFREHALDYDWWEYTYEDAKNVGLKITSFNLDHQQIEGDFIGTALETLEGVLKEHGESCETYKTAKRYEKSLRKATAKANTDEDYEELENTAHEFKLDLLEDYRIMLQHEVEYQLSNEAVDENIKANKYEFTETGKRA